MIAEGVPLRRYSWFKTREAGRNFFYMAARQQASWLLFLYLIAGTASASAQTGSPVPTAETIITRMAQARAENRARLRPYIVTRDYKLFGKDGSKTKSEVIADVAFVPPDSKKYTIQVTNGSGLGQMIVRRMLPSEAEVTKDFVSTDILADNYDFRFIRQVDVSGQRCYVLELLPRRKENHLLRGDIWVDANTYLLRRFEGELAKTPSWWVRDVRVTFVYGDGGPQPRRRRNPACLPSLIHCRRPSLRYFSGVLSKPLVPIAEGKLQGGAGGNYEGFDMDTGTSAIFG